METPLTAPLQLLARSETWTVVAKPSGMAVHRSAMVRDRHTVLTVLRDQIGQRVYPVHRLDRPTSGCLLFAFDGPTAGRLQRALAEGTKRYLAFVRGHTPSRDEVLVERSLKDDNGYMKSARTWLRPVASCLQPRCSLILARPETGRFHQIRRHLRGLSHPVLGDGTHGDSRVNRTWREEHGLPRLGLHCLSLKLTLPEGGVLAVTCPVPEDLLSLWSSLPLWDEARRAVTELDLPPLTHEDT